MHVEFVFILFKESPDFKLPNKEESENQEFWIVSFMVVFNYVVYIVTTRVSIVITDYFTIEIKKASQE